MLKFNSIKRRAGPNITRILRGLRKTKLEAIEFQKTNMPALLNIPLQHPQNSSRKNEEKRRQLIRAGVH